MEAELFDGDGEQRGGVMSVPPILALEVWEALAMPQLRALALAAAEDIDRCVPVQPYIDPMPQPLDAQIEGVHFHRPDPHRRQDAPPLPAKRPPLPPVSYR